MVCILQNIVMAKFLSNISILINILAKKYILTENISICQKFWQKKYQFQIWETNIDFDLHLSKVQRS